MREVIAAHDGNGPRAPDQATIAGHRADIQGLRGLAVLLVVAYHADFVLAGGFVGVDAFFVVSGFVITRMLLRELEDNRRVDFRRFYLRRVRRLLPALALALAVTMLLGILLVPLGAQVFTARTGVAAALLNANTYLSLSDDGGYFATDAESNALLHIWSLSVEEQFYLIFPALVAMGWALSRRINMNPIRGVTLVLGLIAGISLPLQLMLISGLLNPGGRGPDYAFYSAPSRAWEFAVGGLLAVSAAYTFRLSRGAVSSASVVGLAAVLGSALWYDDATLFPGITALAPVLGTALLVAAGGSTQSSVIQRLLSLRPMQWLGDMSYSWYLWHWPVIVFAVGLWPLAPLAKPVAAVVSVVPAYVSYRVIESPIRFRSSPSARRTLALVGACTVLPLLTAYVLMQSSGPLSRMDQLDAFAFHADRSSGCSSSRPMGDRDPESCLWPADDGVGQVVLVGDSNAGHLVEGFITASKLSSFDARLVTNSGCPFVDLRVIADNVDTSECHNFVTLTLEHLSKASPDMVVIASASDLYIESEDIGLQSPDEGIVALEPLAKQDLWEAGLGRIIQRLDSADIEVVIVHPVPRLSAGWDPYRMSPLRLAGPEASLNTSVSRIDALRFRERAIAAELAAAPNAQFVDLFDELCPLDHCSAYDGKEFIFLDANHITVAAAERMGETLGLSIAAAAGAG